MIRYYLDNEAYDLLAIWAEQNKTRTVYAPYYEKKAEVYLKNDKRYYGFKLAIESTLYGYKFGLLYPNEGQVVKGQLKKSQITGKDFDILFDIKNVDKLSDERKEELVYVMQVCLTAYIHCNAFMWYGNMAESKTITASGKNKNEHTKNVTFRAYKDSLYAVPFRHHKSPDGVFSVRGHFRHYKDGKIIWIDEYLKGE